MKKILVPISFSEKSKSSVQYAFEISKHIGGIVHLIHCYSAQEFNREYDFKGEDYNVGIRKMMRDFFYESIGSEEKKERFHLVTHQGSLAQILLKITPDYDLLVFSRKTGVKFSFSHWLSDKLSYLYTQSLCPTLITSFNQELAFAEIENIWLIKRDENETKILEQSLLDFHLETRTVTTKFIKQSSFISEFWEKVISYSETHNKKLLDGIDDNIKKEHVDLIAVVNHQQGFFETFAKDDTFQTLLQFNIPIMILQDLQNEKT